MVTVNSAISADWELIVYCTDADPISHCRKNTFSVFVCLHGCQRGDCQTREACSNKREAEKEGSSKHVWFIIKRNVKVELTGRWLRSVWPQVNTLTECIGFMFLLEFNRSIEIITNGIKIKAWNKSLENTEVSVVYRSKISENSELCIRSLLTWFLQLFALYQILFCHFVVCVFLFFFLYVKRWPRLRNQKQPDE